MTADKLEGLSDRNHVVHARSDGKRLDLMAAPAAADRGNDGALRAARDVRLESGFADALNDVLDLLFGGAVGHVHNHGDYLSRCSSIGRQKTKAAILSRLWRNS